LFVIPAEAGHKVKPGAHPGRYRIPDQVRHDGINRKKTEPTKTKITVVKRVNFIFRLGMGNAFSRAVSCFFFVCFQNIIGFHMWGSNFC